MAKKNTIFGVSYEIKLPGVDKTLWVRKKQLNKGVIQSFENKTKLPPTAKAQVKRAFYESVKQHLTGAPATPESALEKKLQLSKRAAGWVVHAQRYVAGVNKVLKCKMSDRVAVRQKVLEQLNPPKDLLPYLQTCYFLTGKLERWKGKGTVLNSTPGNPGSLTCSVCKEDYKWPRVSRACMHVLSNEHHKKLQACNQLASTQASQDLLQKHSASPLEGKRVVELVTSYAAQATAARSLPFTAGEMALDCASAAVSTIVGKDPISDAAIDSLISNGHKVRVVRQAIFN